MESCAIGVHSEELPGVDFRRTSTRCLTAVCTPGPSPLHRLLAADSLTSFGKAIEEKSLDTS
jgi:hypothetical protein